MGHRHTKAEILRGALETAHEDGLSQLTFGRVAKHLGINDRMIVYYFPTKDDLIAEVVVSMGLDLQKALEAAFTTPADDYVELAKAAWPVLCRTQNDPTFALYFEASGLAIARRSPFDTLVPMIVEAWIEWTATFVRGTAKQRRTEAEAAVAVIDGLLLLRQVQGAAAANRAASRLGIR